MAGAAARPFSQLARDLKRTHLKNIILPEHVMLMPRLERRVQDHEAREG